VSIEITDFSRRISIQASSLNRFTVAGSKVASAHLVFGLLEVLLGTVVLAAPIDWETTSSH